MFIAEEDKNGGKDCKAGANVEHYKQVMVELVLSEDETPEVEGGDADESLVWIFTILLP